PIFTYNIPKQHRELRHMEWSPNPKALLGRIAVVAGATRGAGRGIAAALGEAGATVICTGRSTRSTRSEYNRPETIEETAELVNDIWGGELLKGGPADWNKPIWTHKLETGLRILRLAVETHLITSHYLLPLLIQRPGGRPGGLLVEVTDGTVHYNGKHYRISVFYDLAKVAVNRLAFSQGHELEPHGATAVAITPGWLRSEMMLQNFGVTEENWRKAMARG